VELNARAGRRLLQDTAECYRESKHMILDPAVAAFTRRVSHPLAALLRSLSGFACCTKRSPAGSAMRRVVRSTGPVLILVALHLSGGCATLTSQWTAPEVELVGARPKVLGLDRQSLILNLRVKNPNDRALPIKGLTYRVQVEGRELAEGSSALERLIPPGGTEQVDVEVSSNLLALMPELPRLLLTDDALDWTVSGIAYAHAAGVSVPLPFRYSGKVDPKVLLSGALR
jgi:LEA14-like dessication related protein